MTNPFAKIEGSLAALPFAEKVKLLEQLRDRSLAIVASPLKRQLSHRS